MEPTSLEEPTEPVRAEAMDSRKENWRYVSVFTTTIRSAGVNLQQAERSRETKVNVQILVLLNLALPKS